MRGSEQAQKASQAARASEAEEHVYADLRTQSPAADRVAILHASSTGKGLLIAFSNGVEAFLEAEALLRMVEHGEGIILSEEESEAEPAGLRLLPVAAKPDAGQDRSSHPNRVSE